MTAQIYHPAGGIFGKARRLAARMEARRLVTVKPDRPIVSFSFDDFPQSAATTGAELLEARGWRGTYYASAGFAGGKNHLGRMYDIADLHRLHRDGHEIGCHTYAHDDAARMDNDALLAEVERNQRCLTIAGHEAKLRSFAFPFGEASGAAKRTLSGRFSALRGVRPGVNRGEADFNLLKAVSLDGGEAGLKRALSWVKDAAQRPGWLILFGHDVREQPGEWGCTPDFLRNVIEAVSAIDAEVMTVADAAERFAGQP
ncbi:MAG: polysaccharide deacetylase family protein [Pseudomonadota bacterium]